MNACMQKYVCSKHVETETLSASAHLEQQVLLKYPGALGEELCHRKDGTRDAMDHPDFPGQADMKCYRIFESLEEETSALMRDSYQTSILQTACILDVNFYLTLLQVLFCFSSI